MKKVISIFAFALIVMNLTSCTPDSIAETQNLYEQGTGDGGQEEEPKGNG